MDFNNIEHIKEVGFTGFKSVRDLFSDSSSIPKTKGVYLILNTESKSDFLAIGTGGYFKGRNPNIPVAELKSNWVDNTIVVYIGKAGKDGSNATLQSRLKQYFRFGQRKNVGHWGGRLIWQLKNSHDLIVCWKALPSEDPRKYEANLIQQFILQFSKRPFANLAN
ncbi:MAG TPA: hypothetical protein DHV28_17150 [Ignavibacteriales bacterium]|nr:hypothetical protein [Ignavibacteriales bacterium]